ncbi:FAD/NAD(P)-binding domain-containing protein [Peniophora sp. CONT]|nr:FAD/NAD(P)-binding domain-containing protein [Peniophora sp. CONT]
MSSQSAAGPDLPLQPKFRVAIVGGGPGGLALAISISKFSHPKAPIVVDLYEAQPEIGTVGAGITIWPRTRALLNELGVMAHFKGELNAQVEPGKAGKGVMLRKSNERQGYPIYHMPTPSNPMMLHRSDFLHALQNEMPAAPQCTTYTSKRLISLTHDKLDGSVTLHFSDGSTSTADVVIGADGIRSAVRASMLSEDERIEPEWPGVIAYRAMIPSETLESHSIGRDHPVRNTAHIYCGIGKHFVTYPIRRGDFVNVVAFVTLPNSGKRFEGKWVRDVPVEEVREAFAGWEPDVENVLQCVETTSAWAVHIVYGAPRCASGRVAILGDAMHATRPHFGAGAGQAMEDAYVLARLLTHPSTTRSTLPQALQAYNRSRLDFSTELVHKTNHVGSLYEFTGVPVPSGAHDHDILEKWRKEVYELWQFQMDEHGAEGFWRDAETYLQAFLSATRRAAL